MFRWKTSWPITCPTWKDLLFLSPSFLQERGDHNLLIKTPFCQSYSIHLSNQRLRSRLDFRCDNQPYYKRLCAWLLQLPPLPILLHSSLRAQLTQTVQIERNNVVWYRLNPQNCLVCNPQILSFCSSPCGSSQTLPSSHSGPSVTHSSSPPHLLRDLMLCTNPFPAMLLSPFLP